MTKQNKQTKPKKAKPSITSIALIFLNWTTRIPEETNKGDSSSYTLDHYRRAIEDIFMKDAVQFSSNN